MTQLTIAKALTNGLRAAMERDPKVLLMGEDIGKLGGVFRVTEGLQKDFGEERVIDTPLAEAGIVGTAVGLALRGYRPVVEIQFDGFVYPAFDHIVSQVAKMRARSLGKVAMPIVIRIPVGGGIGGRNEIMWERRANPGLPAGADGDIVVPVGQRLCGPGWIRGRYQVGDIIYACGHTADGTIPYVARPGEITRVRCSAPEL